MGTNITLEPGERVRDFDEKLSFWSNQALNEARKRHSPNIENHYSLCYSYSVILEEREYPSQTSHSK